MSVHVRYLKPHEPFWFLGEEGWYFGVGDSQVEMADPVGPYPSREEAVEDIPANLFRGDLMEAYMGLMDHVDEPLRERHAIRTIMNDSAKERLKVYLTWNGILGWTESIYAIAHDRIER